MPSEKDKSDICDNCGEDFGLSGDDGDGAYNSRCVHCGSRTYTTVKTDRTED